MWKFLLLQVLFAASLEFNLISCQYQQQYLPSQTQYQTQQVHPTPRPQEHHDCKHPTHSNLLNHDFQPSTVAFDFDKFNQQAKQLQAQVHYFNQQQQKHIQQQINNVHHAGSQPHFDFGLNGNYSDLENANEQFMNNGNLVGKQNASPKVVKMTKTVAVKQPMPMMYPVPVVKIVKDQTAYEHSNQGQEAHQHVPATIEKPLNMKPSGFFNYSSYVNKYPTPAPVPSESYHHQHSAPSPVPNSNEFDTKPFYVTTPQKETIKIVPVPYYIDEHGNKQEVSPHSSSSHDVDSEAFYPSRQASSSSDGSEKFQTFTFSYHPPQQSAHQSQPPQYSQQAQSAPETKYYYNQDSAQSASSDSTENYATEQGGEQEQQYQYKYVTYE